MSILRSTAALFRTNRIPMVRVNVKTRQERPRIHALFLSHRNVVSWALLSIAVVAYLQIHRIGHEVGRNTSKMLPNNHNEDLLVWGLAEQQRSSTSDTRKGTSHKDKTTDQARNSISASKKLTAGVSENPNVFTQFDDDCYMQLDEERHDTKISRRKKHRRQLTELLDGDHRRLLEEPKRPGEGDPDKLHLGPCYYNYPTRTAPTKGYTKDIDFFHFRDAHQKREECFLFCIDQLPASMVQQDSSLLVQAAIMGLSRVAEKLLNRYGLDPLYAPSLGPDYDNRRSFNAIQEAIRGGYAEIVKILTRANYSLIIDDLGRTVKDYIRMKGSPIRPEDAKNILSLDTMSDQMASGGKPQQLWYTEDDTDMGWKQDTVWNISERCDMDIVYGNMSRKTFYNDYFMTGRPFVLRNAVPEEEVHAFAKSRWSQTSHFKPKTLVRVGPTAYPSLTGQKQCAKKVSIEEIEHGKECEDLPGIPIVHARHPSTNDLKELFPIYGGDIYDRKGGWRKLGEFFDRKPEKGGLIWQVFFGGDASGATFHWHRAAFNVLYVGIKEWKITPPKYRGFTGMPAREATKQINDSMSIQCTQHPGDFVYVPNYWGHLTVNHGFSIGAAAILPDDFQKAADAKPRAFFVHINKAGGSSIIQMLEHRCSSQYTSEYWSGGSQRTFHATAHALIDRNGRDSWENAYTFAVVRHPLARVVSNFFFLVDRCSRKKKDWCKDRLIPVGLDLNSLSDEQKIEEFHTYFSKLYDKYPPGSPNHYLLGSRSHGNDRFDTFNATQTSWLVDEKGEIAVKNIFHLETLSKDMSKLAQDLPCLNDNSNDDGSGDDDDDDDDDSNETSKDRNLVEMVHKNQTPKYPDYKLFGHNEHTNRILKEVFAVDFANFGYDL